MKTDEKIDEKAKILGESISIRIEKDCLNCEGKGLIRTKPYELFLKEYKAGNIGLDKMADFLKKGGFNVDKIKEFEKCKECKGIGFFTIKMNLLEFSKILRSIMSEL